MSLNTALIRRNNGCTDTNDAPNDFVIAAPNPRNGSSPFSPCSPLPPLVTVGGKVVMPDGRELRNATVSFTDSHGTVRMATTSSFGLFSFDNVATGDTYTIRIPSRLYRYPPLRVQITGDLTLPDFVGLE